MEWNRLINTHIHRYIHTHEHTPQYVATSFFKSPGADIANIIFSKPIKRKSQTTLGLEFILLSLESELSHVTWFDQGNTSKHDASKAWKVLAHWNYPLGAFGNQSWKEEARDTLADVRNKQSSCPFYPSQTPEMWVRPSGTNMLTTTSSLTDQDHISEPRNCRRTTRLSPD